MEVDLDNPQIRFCPQSFFGHITLTAGAYYAFALVSKWSVQTSMQNPESIAQKMDEL